MHMPDALHLVLSLLAAFAVCGRAPDDRDIRYSMTQATVQQSCAECKIAQTLAFRLKSANPYWNGFVLCPSEMSYPAEADFSEQLRGGMLLRFEFGLIVVESTSSPEPLQPTALTTDAIITSAVRSRIAGESELPPQNFEIQTDAGIVTIHAKAVSLDQAAKVINLALSVPDVRQIVYRMPLSSWRTAGR